MLTEYHVIQFILYCLMAKTEGHSAQTEACTVSFGTAQYYNTQLSIIQSKINNSHYYPNTHHNVLLP